MEFTGERFVPELKGTIELEHIHRYRQVLPLIRNQAVLDIACGEGYGSAILSTEAQKIIGVDVDTEAISHARECYGRQENLEFLVGELADIPLPDNSFDAITCFESIEHIVEHDVAMVELKRVLKPGGVLYISTPEKKNYSDLTGYRNPYHPKELYLSELKVLLSKHFRHFKVQGQRVMLSSVILGEDESTVEWIRHPRFEQSNFIDSAVYLIARASDMPIDQVKGSVYEGSSTLDDLLFERPLIESPIAGIKQAIKLTKVGAIMLSLKRTLSKLRN